MEKRKINIVIVDDHMYHNSASEAMLRDHDQIVVLGSATNDREMYKLLKQHSEGGKCSVDILLLDVEMPGEKGKDGIEIASEIIGSPDYPNLKILCFSVNTQLHVLRILLKDIVVHGYLDKQEVTRDDLSTGIFAVYEGKIKPFVSKGLRKKVKRLLGDDEFKLGVDSFTDREQQIFPYIAKGLSNTEIALELFHKGLSTRLISAKTIDIHRGNVYQKLVCSNAAEVAEIYFNRMRLQTDSIDELPNFKKE